MSSSAQKVQKLVDGNSRSPDERPEGARSQLFMLRNREVCPNTILDEDQVAAYLPDSLPTVSLESFRRLFAGKFANRDTNPPSDCDYDGCELRIEPASSKGLLVLGPEPGPNGLLDILERFLLVLPLGDASGQSRTLRNEPAFLVFLESHVKQQDPASAGILRSWGLGRDWRDWGLVCVLHSARSCRSPVRLGLSR